MRKIHVMTDKSSYATGDTIWLRAFVVDAATHRPVYVSKYVYVELRIPFDAVCPPRLKSCAATASMVVT